MSTPDWMPPLPEAGITTAMVSPENEPRKLCGAYFTHDQMPAYALAAVKAYRESLKPAMWMTPWAPAASGVEVGVPLYRLDGGDDDAGPTDQSAEIERLRLEIKRISDERDALREKVDTMREFLQFWTHDGKLQTFQSREQFRAAARAEHDDEPEVVAIPAIPNVRPNICLDPFAFVDDAEITGVSKPGRYSHE